jgi:hypothetical protein
MAGNRIIYQNWIAESGVDPARQRAASVEAESRASLEEMIENGFDFSRESSQCTDQIDSLRDAVRRALDELEEDEREFVARFHFMGESYRQISESSGRAIHKLESLHKRAVRKLKRILAPLMVTRFEVKLADHLICPLCDSEDAEAIDLLIAGRDPHQTWRPVIGELKQKYNIVVRSPQLLIGHEKYH